MNKPASDRVSLARRLKNKWTGPVVGTVLSVGIGLVLLRSVEKLVFWSYDIPTMLHKVERPNDVVMVYLDEETYTTLGELMRVPLPRHYHASLIQRMTKDKAKAVIFDIVFSDPNPDDTNSDVALINATKENGRVILAADRTPASESEPGIGHGDRYLRPFDLLDTAAADVGTAEMLPGDDLVIREQIPFSTNDPYPSLSWATARFLGAPVTRDQNQWSRTRWNYYYGPDKTLPFISYYQALEVSPTVPEGYFSNKIVFVGSRVFTVGFADRKDAFPTPYLVEENANKFMPGVEIQATQVLNLIHGDWLSRFPDKIERLLLVLSGVIFGAGLVFLRPLSTAGCSVLSALAVGVINYELFVRFHYWFPWLIVVLGQIPAAAVWSVTYNTVQLYVEKRLVEQSLSLYLSPKLVKKFAKDPTLLKPGALKQLLTILFSDIAGFTSISEGMDPDELARLMNEYFQSAVSHCIHETDGTVVKYIGDAIFAFWNAPDPQGDHAFLACDAALRFRGLPVQTVNGTELVTRIGLHTGVANVGNFGSTARVDYTAIGESINLASRMEGLNKYLGTRVLITEETQREAGARLVTRYLGLFRLKGFEKAVGVYELIARPDKEADSRPLREGFALALDQFTKKDFASAEAAFHGVLEKNVKDGPSTFYLEQIAELRAAELPPDWKGEIVLKDK